MHRELRPLLLRLYFYKTSKEQPKGKAHNQMSREQISQKLPFINPTGRSLSSGKQGFTEIDAPSRKNLA